MACRRTSFFLARKRLFGTDLSTTAAATAPFSLQRGTALVNCKMAHRCASPAMKTQPLTPHMGSICTVTSRHITREGYTDSILVSPTHKRWFGTGGEDLYRRLGGYGYPMMYVVTYDRPSWQPLWEEEHNVMPRDEFGVPAHIPPEVSTTIKHVYHVPPQYYPFLKKLGVDTPALQAYTNKLISGDFTHDDYEEMFYKFAHPLKVYRRLIPIPYRTKDEIAKEAEVKWEGKWLSYRQRILADYNCQVFMREYLAGILIGIYFAYLWADAHRQYRLDMKLFYLDAPEHKINWVKPRGDLV